MRHPLKLVLPLIFVAFLAPQNPAMAATQLNIAYRYYLDQSYVEGFDLETDAFIIGSPEETNALNALKRASKNKQLKPAIIRGCKVLEWDKERVRVVSASGSTAGLGYLGGISVSSFTFEESIQSLPSYSDEEYQQLSEQWIFEDLFPDYIEDGYRFYTLNVDCIYSGKISLTSSNAYTVWIGNRRSMEYSRAELAKQKWKVTLVYNG